MAWMMPHESTRHERTWMAFPRAGNTLGSGERWREGAYRAWSDVALAIAEFEPVTVVVDPTEMARARDMLGSAVGIMEAPLDEFWMRDCGPTFVVDTDRPGVLGAVDWIFNGWGDRDWAQWRLSAQMARRVAAAAGAELISSLLVNEGGGIHVDGEGTVLATETVQLDPRRNPHADKARVEAEFARTLGVSHVIWLPSGCPTDYDDIGTPGHTNGHVDVVAAFAAPGRVLMHVQHNPRHPDFETARALEAFMSTQSDAAGRKLEIIELPAPGTVRDDTGYVGWGYVNHLVVNGGIIVPAFGDAKADAAARDILEAAYPGHRAVAVDARPIAARGGGIHCITQQQPRVDAVS